MENAKGKKLRRSPRIRSRRKGKCPGCDLKQESPVSTRKRGRTGQQDAEEYDYDNNNNNSQTPQSPKRNAFPAMSEPVAPVRCCGVAMPGGRKEDSNSASAQFRSEGNIMYKKAFQEGIPPVIRSSRLEDALRLYKRAVAAATGPNSSIEWSSATKNCGMAVKRMAEEALKNDETEAKTLRLFRQALGYMKHALIRGGDAQGFVWSDKLKTEIEATYLAVMDIVDDFPDCKDKVRELYQVADVMPDGVLLGRVKFTIADLLFKESVRLLESGNYKECLNCLYDIHQPVEEALLLFRKNEYVGFDAVELKLDLRVLRGDAQYNISTAESMQARKCGEMLLEKILQSEEFVNMDLVWDAVDWFKQASIKAAEIDLENEAAAYSFLGLINEKLLFSVTKTKKYYKKCLELAEAAKPKTFYGTKWYEQCVEGYMKIQEAQRRRDEEAEQKKRQKILDTMKDEMAALKEANSQGRASSLLEHVYEHHAPPKKAKFTAKDLETLKKNEDGPQGFEERKARKKLLLKACQDFHPDKFVEKKGESEEDEAKRKVLMEEITKLITSYYETLKLG